MTDSPASLTRHVPRDLSVDQQLALRTAATRLHDEFSDTFGVETIERLLHSSYDRFAGRATVANFLPLLAERFARQRLSALARVEGKVRDGKPTVLFLCTHNAGRSQMALGFFTHLAGDRAVAWSGGSEPGDEIIRSIPGGGAPYPRRDRKTRSASLRPVGRPCGRLSTDVANLRAGNRFTGTLDADPARECPAWSAQGGSTPVKCAARQ